ncbi:hypothetical protein DRQ09_03485, partial [candidate division KSB1 bacterium]
MKRILIFSLILLFINCSINRMIIRTINDIITYEVKALYEERDPILAENAIASNLKILEGLIKSDPENEKLLLIASEGFFNYSLGFIEEKDKDRAKEFYRRGRDYAMRILFRKKGFKS